MFRGSSVWEDVLARSSTSHHWPSHLGTASTFRSLRGLGDAHNSRLRGPRQEGDAVGPPRKDVKSPEEGFNGLLRV